ncbi:MAG: hypothetical protein RH860_11960 [Cytophagales bacterium]
MMKVISYISIFLVLTGFKSLAQSQFKEARLILNSGDSLKGLIDYRGDYLMARECRFKSDEKSEISVYNPYEIIAFWFKDSKYFISKNYNSDRYFFEFLVDGQMDVLYLRESGEGNYFIGKDSLALIKLPYKKGLRFKNETAYAYESTIHNGILKLYTNDQPTLEKNINSIKSPNHKNLISFARNYHDLSCESEDCIVYEKKSGKINFGLELISAYTIFVNNNSDLVERTYFAQNSLMQYGFIIHLWMPRTSEKIFLRTGYSLMYVNNSEVEGIVGKMPLMIEYQYPKYKIRPRFAYGLNFYRPHGHTAGLNTGFNVILSKYLNLTFNYDLEFIPINLFPLAPKFVFSNSFGGGLYMRL